MAGELEDAMLQAITASKDSDQDIPLLVTAHSQATNELLNKFTKLQNRITAFNKRLEQEQFEAEKKYYYDTVTHPDNLKYLNIKQPSKVEFFSSSNNSNKLTAMLITDNTGKCTRVSVKRTSTNEDLEQYHVPEDLNIEHTFQSLRLTHTVKDEFFPNKIKKLAPASSALIDEHQSIQKDYNDLKNEAILKGVISQESLDKIERSAGVLNKIDQKATSDINAVQKAYNTNAATYNEVYDKYKVSYVLILAPYLIPLAIIAVAITGLIHVIDYAIKESNISNLAEEAEKQKTAVIKGNIGKSSTDKCKFRIFQCAQELTKDDTDETSQIVQAGRLPSKR